MTEQAPARMRVSTILSPRLALKETLRRWWRSQNRNHKKANKRGDTTSTIAPAPAPNPDTAQSQAIVPFDRFSLAVAVVDISNPQTALVHEHQYNVNPPSFEAMNYTIARGLERHEVAISELQAVHINLSRQVNEMGRKIDKILDILQEIHASQETSSSDLSPCLSP